MQVNIISNQPSFESKRIRVTPSKFNINKANRSDKFSKNDRFFKKNAVNAEKVSNEQFLEDLLKIPLPVLNHIRGVIEELPKSMRTNSDVIVLSGEKDIEALSMHASALEAASKREKGGLIICVPKELKGKIPKQITIDSESLPKLLEKLKSEQ